MMTAQEFIETGLIELTALGLASEQEAAQVTRMRQQYPEIEEAWQLVAQDLMVAADAYAAPAPSKVRSSLFAQIELETKDDSGIDNVTDNVKKVDFTKAVNTSNDQATTSDYADIVPISAQNNWRWLAAASIAVTLLSGVINLVLYNRLQDTQAQLAAAEKEQTVLAASYKQSNDKVSELEQQLAFTADPAMPRIMLSGMSTAKDASMLVVWDPAKKVVALGAKNLPAVPADKDLQLWAIVDGKPVDLGLISMDSSGPVITKEIPDITGPQAFAITLEDKGGHPQPQGDMWLMGKASN